MLPRHTRWKAANQTVCHGVASSKALHVRQRIEQPKDPVSVDDITYTMPRSIGRRNVQILVCKLGGIFASVSQINSAITTKKLKIGWLSFQISNFKLQAREQVNPSSPSSVAGIREVISVKVSK